VWIGGGRGRRSALCGCYGRIKTFAKFAVAVLMLLPISSTAIAVIPVTAAVVVLVVAVTVLGESFQSTFAFAFPMGSHGSCRSNKVLLCRVETLAFFAVTVLVFVPALATTVTAVPSATAIVVCVVAVTIFEVKLCSARFRSRAFRFRCGGRFFGGLGRGGGCAGFAANIFELERFSDKRFEVSTTVKAKFSNENQCCLAVLHSFLCFAEGSRNVIIASISCAFN
jgi:hypothetical protein